MRGKSRASGARKEGGTEEEEEERWRKEQRDGWMEGGRERGDKRSVFVYL